MEHIKAFFHKHPIESALLSGVALIALYFAFKPAASNNGASQEAALQNAYFQAESIQAQSNAAVQVAGITTSAQTAQTQIAADASTTNATTYANEDVAINTSNNQAAVSALPYAEEDNLISSLGTVAALPPTITTVHTSSGLFGSVFGNLFGGAGNTKTVSTPNPSAVEAQNTLAELANGLFPGNG